MTPTAAPSRIIVVDDDSDQLELVKRLLNNAGFMVQTAGDAITGFNLVKNMHPDLVISDVAMPQVDGIALCSMIRSQDDLSTTPIILVSALQKDSAIIVEGLQKGADDYLEIPYEPAILIAKAARLIEFSRVAENIHAERERLRFAITCARMGFWEWNIHTKQVYWSEELERIHGLKPGKFDKTFDSFLKGVYFDDLELVKSSLNRTLEEGCEHDIEYRIVWPDMSIHWVEGRGCVIRDRIGRPMHMIGLCMDITTRKHDEELLKNSHGELEKRVEERTKELTQANDALKEQIAEREIIESKLRASEEHYRLLFENNPHPMWVYDLETLHFLAVNEAALQHYGYSREEFLLLNVKDVYLMEDASPLLKHLQKDPTFTSKETGIWKHKKKDGAIIEVEINEHLLTFYDVSARLVLALDVTERSSLEEQLRQSQKLEAIGQLAGGIAHDFNNLLTAITGYSDLAIMHLREEDPLHRNIAEIKKAAELAASLTRQLLAFSRKQILQPKVINLNATVSNINQMLQRVIGEDIELKIALAANPGIIKADAGQIEQVIMNLVVNARDAMPEGGKLIIETANVYLDHDYTNNHFGFTVGPYVMLAVSDTGCGMNEQTQSHIFEPFYTTKEVGKGTGLGLSTVYGIVKQSGGNILVYSEPEHGTTFKIYLPSVYENAKDVQTNTVRQQASNGTETILLTEDDEAVRGLTREALEMKGYKVLEAFNGATALAICEQHEGKIHLLLTDLVMPEMSGRELAMKLEAKYPEIRVLYMSGYANSAIIHHGYLEEETNFIAKPFSVEALMRKVREVLDAPKS